MSDRDRIAADSANPSYYALIDDATRILFDGSDTPRIDAEVLLQHVVAQPLAWLLANGKRAAIKEHMKGFYRLVKLRQKGQPIAYLTGHKEFWSLSLKVTPDVLIPRPDTETLVESALAVMRKRTQPKILDLGTGCGAIALAIAKERPDSTVLAVDSSPAALHVAAENAQTAELPNVEFLLSNWFRKVPRFDFDLIAANPPYVSANDPHLQLGDLRFEPSSALVGGSDGLDDLRQIILGSINYLAPKGILIVEHGSDQEDPVRKLFDMVGFDGVRCRKDINHLPRCTFGRLRA